MARVRLARCGALRREPSNAGTSGHVTAAPNGSVWSAQYEDLHRPRVVGALPKSYRNKP